MPRAVLKDGIIYPLEPLPPDWTNGKQVWVDDAGNSRKDLEAPTAADIDEWFERLEALCLESDPHNEAILQAAIVKQRQEGKERMRRELGISE